jgi:hypothetical protein
MQPPKDPMRERRGPSETPDSLPRNPGGRNPFPERQPKEIPLHDPPGDVTGDPQGDVIGDPKGPEVSDPSVNEPPRPM